MNLRTVKGTRDFLVEQTLVRNKLIAQLKEVFELFGYNPIETPALEMQDTLASKFAGGEEILKEIFTLTDNANRQLGLRYDLTVPFARVVAMNPQLKKPFKRYQIDRVWRNGPIKLGRYREFYQCDVDVVGITSVSAEAELLALIETFFASIQKDIIIKVNNRKLLDAIMQEAKIAPQICESAILSLDKLAKIGADGVKKELEQKGFSSKQIQTLFDLVTNKTLEDYQKLFPENQGVKELLECFSFARAFGVKNAVFDVTLARGLSYYTGTVWEVYLKESTITSSVGAGGRFDDMVGQFTSTKQPIAAVGTSFGLDVLLDAILSDAKTKQRASAAQVYVIAMGKKRLPDAISYAMQFRAGGIKTDIDLNGRSLKKNIEFADKLGIAFVAIIGEDEVKSKKVMLKQLDTGEQQLCTLADAVLRVRSYGE
ncbi:MAG: histidine--tRNA ligase [Candidatus Woesearchaeota archaeon]